MHHQNVPQYKPVPSLLDSTVRKLCSRDEIEFGRDLPLDFYFAPLLERCLQQANASSVFLPPRVADKLLKRLSNENLLSSNLFVLLLQGERPVAHPSALPLGGSIVTSDDLRHVRSLTGVTEVDLSFTRNLGATWYDVLFACKDTVRSLKMCHASGVTDFARIADFPKLVHLDLSFTSLTTDDALSICMALAGLQYLDISGTEVNLYGVLPQLKQLVGIRYLGLHQLVIPPFPEMSTEVPLSSIDILNRVASTFGSLTELQHLDISWMKYQNYSEGWMIDAKEFLHCILSSQKSLKSLEIAKMHLSLSDVVQELKDCDLYHQMEFLGFLDDHRVMVESADIVQKVSNDMELVIFDSKAGTSRQVMKPEYLRRPLTVLANVANVLPDITNSSSKLTDLVRYVLQALRMYGDRVDVMADVLKSLPQAVMSARALADDVIVALIDLLLYLAIRHPEEASLPRCLYYVLNVQTRHVVKNKVLLSRLMAFILQSSDNAQLDDSNQVKLLSQSYEVINIVLYHLTPEQRVWLACDMGLIDSCLKLARRWYQRGDFHESAVYGLGAVWNICDDLPQNCRHVVNFEEFDVVDFLVDFGNTFINKEDAVTSVIGPLGNIAEVTELRNNLRKPKLISFLAKTLKIDSMGDVICLTSSRLICNLSMDEGAVWPVEGIVRQQLLTAMYHAMKQLSIQPNMHRLISYRSLAPLLDLARCTHSPEVMYFGVWRLASLCIEHTRYANMLQNEGGLELLSALEVPAGFEDDFKPLVDTIQEKCTNAKSAPPMFQMPPGMPPIPGGIPPELLAGMPPELANLAGFDLANFHAHGMLNDSDDDDDDV